MNQICPTVSGLAGASKVLISELKKQKEVSLKCRIKLEPGSGLFSRSEREKCKERLSNAVECIEEIEEQIEFNTALVNMFLDADE